MYYQPFIRWPWINPDYRTFVPDNYAKAKNDYCCMEKGTISVNGEGTIKVPPNKAAVVLGIVTRKDILNEALDENNRIIQNVIDSLISLGIDKRNIGTQYFNVIPIYSQDEGEVQIIIGYEVTNAIEVDLQDINILGRVITSSINAGANRVNNIRFYNDDTEVREMALRKAIEEANQKASTIASELSLRILRVKSVNGGWNNVRPFYVDAAVKAESAVPIIPGEIEVTSNINIEYYVEQ